MTETNEIEMDEWLGKHKEAGTANIDEMTEQLDDSLERLQEALAVISQWIIFCTKATVDEEKRTFTIVFSPTDQSELDVQTVTEEV